jgi:hypothetical protein
MAQEVRYILFSDNEAIWALVHWRRGLGLGVSDGTVRSFVTHVSNGHPEALLAIEPGAGRRLEEHVFKEDELKDALVGYCRYRGIPLPLEAGKSLEITRGRIGLVVTVETSDAAVRMPGRAVPTRADVPARTAAVA